MTCNQPGRVILTCHQLQSKGRHDSSKAVSPLTDRCRLLLLIVDIGGVYAMVYGIILIRGLSSNRPWSIASSLLVGLCWGGLLLGRFEGYCVGHA